MRHSRRRFLARTATALAALSLPRRSRAAEGPAFRDRGYYVTFMRMPTFGLGQWKRIVDCFSADGANLLLLWVAGAFKSEKFPVTWKYNADHENVRNDFVRDLIRYAQSKGVRVLLGFTPFGYDGVNQYALERPDLKARKADGSPVDAFGIHCWGYNLCPSKPESQRFMLEYVREMAFGFYPEADGLLIESSDYAACHCADCKGNFYRREFEVVRRISDELWARKPRATVLVYPHYFSGAKEVPGLHVSAAAEKFDPRWSVFFTPHSAPPDAGLIRAAKSSVWSDDSTALRGPGGIRESARKARSLGVSGYVPSLEAFSYVPTHPEEGQAYLVGRRQVPFGFGWLRDGEVPYDELPVRVNRIAYREFARDPELSPDEFKRRLGREVFGRDAGREVDDLLAVHDAFFGERTWCQAAPLASPARAAEMKRRGELTPARSAGYRAALDRLREIEKRYREETSGGGAAVRRIAAWVLSLWDGNDAALLAP